MQVTPHIQPAPVVGLYVIPGAGAYYRIVVPLGTIGGAWASAGEAARPLLETAETLVLSRVTGDPRAIATSHAALRARGVRVVVDVDDDPDSLPLAMRRHLEGQRAAMRTADAVVCTGPHLAARLRRYHRDVRVLPNYVRPDDWPAPAPLADGPPVVTLTGSPSHTADWRIVAGPLARLKARHRFVLRVAGHLPPYLRHLCDDHRPWTGDLATYPAMLADSHIGLCPLPNTAFNRCKSPIKAYELALAGAAVVASPTQYGPVLAAAGLGHAVAHADGDWERQIARLLTDPDARAAEAQALRQHVIATCDARQHVATIRAAYAA